MTPITSATRYCSGADFCGPTGGYYDIRVIGDLVSDNGVRNPAPASSARVLAALDAGSGEVEAACLVAGRYSPDDLNSLTGMGQAHLKRIVASLAYFYLRSGRGRPEDQMPHECEAAWKALDRLRLGERIFGFTETQEAGTMEAKVVDQEQVVRWNGIQVQASRWLGRRSWQYRGGF